MNTDTAETLLVAVALGLLVSAIVIGSARKAEAAPTLNTQNAVAETEQ